MLGLCVGVVNVIIHIVHYMVHELDHDFQHEWHIKEGAWQWHVYKAVLVMIGAVFVSYVVHKWVPECAGGGSIPVKACIALGSHVPARVGICRLVLTIIYLGTGNPLGIESPTLHICA